jgi:hypothetical protein
LPAVVTEAPEAPEAAEAPAVAVAVDEVAVRAATEVMQQTKYAQHWNQQFEWVV